VRFYGIVARESEKNLKGEDSEEAAEHATAEDAPGEDAPGEDATGEDATETPPAARPPTDDAPARDAERDEAEGKSEGKSQTKGRRRPVDAPIAPPKAPPPVAQKERSYTWFPEIAEAGGGRAEILDAQDSLVAEIAELTIADRYRAEFADFFAAFRLLCK
jgi:hypothetical protein